MPPATARRRFRSRRISRSQPNERPERNNCGRQARGTCAVRDRPRRRMDVWTEDYFTRSKTKCDAVEPIMPSTVMVFPSALRVVLDVPVPPGPATELS